MGWTGNKNRTDHSGYYLDLSDGANRFKTESLNWVVLRGIEQILNIYLKLGKNDIEEYNLILIEYLYARAAEIKVLDLVDCSQRSEDQGSYILGFF